MKADELKQRFPRASKSFLAANLSVDATGQTSFLESDSRDAPLAPEKVQRRTGERFLVRVTSIRNRLLDEDNLCEKYHVDLCRYAGILPDDAPGEVEIKVGQRKAAKGETEKTVIEIFALQRQSAVLK